MFQVEGLTFEEVEGELAAFEEIFRDAVRRVMEDVAAELGHVLVAAGDPGESAVSMDTLGLIATLWITQVQGEPEGGGEEDGNGSLGAALHAVFRRAVNRIRRALLPYKAQVAPVIPRHPSVGPSPSVEVDVPSIPDEDSDALDAIPDLPEDLAEHYLSRARNRMVRFSDDLWYEARAQLLEGFQEGESIEELRDRLVNVVGLTEKRATVVARTEIISASSAGSLAMVQYADFTGTKTWLATEDDRTRPTHREAEGQTVPLEETFSVGGSALQFPGDPSGAPEEIIQCRCVLLFDLDDEPLVASVTCAEEFCRNPLHPGPCKGKGKGRTKEGGESGKKDKKTSSPGKSYDDPQKAKAFIDDNFSDWKKSLTSAESSGIGFYQSPGFALMNGQLRGLNKSDIKADVSFNDEDLARARKASIALKKAIAKAPPLPEDITVYRGFSADQFGELQSGMTIKDKGFVSTSLTSKDVGSVGKAKSPAVATIKIPKGFKVGAGTARELIIPPGSSFRVGSVTKKGGVTHVELELVI